ncbi:ankyrin repeat domain-containing protein [Flavobacterium sp. MAH-1]|uniref:Ankyrin repeat domain-containing protein n=1 Tax=Flavobacterium agri TaxID=2743471 RepID=A0A7Y9C6G2_9FLAO|nr:ankyrin repeat domain-containing protein [Flavobacterium agri]NUY82337.1 ankyrin repeat domain-containing protein [Flavobacterium agri]NYA72361.1 ankyrin repeat domain-containing protein [Flavobacterium agri]
MKKSIIYLGLALVSFVNVAIANETSTVSVSDPKPTVKFVGGTPLCNAISKGEIEFVKKMVEYGADVNEKSNGMTPLMVAARYNQIEIAKFLLSKGASTKEKSENGFTALKWAEATGSKEIADLLAKA